MSEDTPSTPPAKSGVAELARDPKALTVLGILGLLLSSGLLASTRDLDAISARQAVIEADVRALRQSLSALVEDLDEARDEARTADKLMVEVNQRLKSLEAKP